VCLFNCARVRVCVCVYISSAKCVRLRVIYIVRDIVAKENSWIKYELRQFRVSKCIFRKRSLLLQQVFDTYSIQQHIYS